MSLSKQEKREHLHKNYELKKKPKVPVFTYPEKPKPEPREATKREYERANSKRSSKKSREISRKEVDSLATRDGYRRCKACHTEDNLTVDRVIPTDLGGKNILSNKQILCFKCNNLKANRPPGKNEWWPDNVLNVLQKSFTNE